MAKLKMAAHPVGVFVATLYGIAEDTSQHGPVLKWRWQTDEGEIIGLTSRNYSASDKSKVRAIAKALLGEAPEELDTDMLLTRSCQIVVKQDGDFARVVDYLPIPSNKVTAADLFAGP